MANKTMYFCTKCAECNSELRLFKLKFKGQLITETPGKTRFNITCPVCGHEDNYPFYDCYEVELT